MRTAMGKIPKRVMIISFDAVGERDLAFLRTLPNFSAFLDRAALCPKAESVYPSITYPAHTSIVTGRMPKNHGIINNTKLQPGRDTADWVYQRKYIRGTTLYDEARKKGYRTAALLWPVVGRSKIDYYVPEVMVTRRWQTQILVNAVNGPVGYQLDLNRRFGHLRDGIRQPALDDFIQASALYTIRRYNPGLFLLHLTDVDTNRHIYGVNHPKVTEALRRHDRRLGEIMTALSETGDMDDTSVIVLGDHYQKDVDKISFLNHALWKEGLLTIKDGKLKDWQAIAKSCDGSCYLYLKEGRRADAALQKRVRDLAEHLLLEDRFGIGRIFTAQEAAQRGADPSCFLMLEAREGWYFLEGWEKPFCDVKDEKRQKMRGNHGYLPGEEGYQTFFAAKGCGIRPGTVNRRIALWDEGATLAALMGLDLGKTDGNVIDEILEDGAVF